MVDALYFFCTSFLNWLATSVSDFVSKIDIVDFGTVAILSLAIIIFLRSIGGNKNG